MAFVSHKCQYALRAVFELAKHQGERPVKISHIAEAQDIPQRFLENILPQLKQAGLLESRRGKEGGYLLTRNSQELTVGEVITAVDGPLIVVDCQGEATGADCKMNGNCVFLPLWAEAQKSMMDVYNRTTFADLLEDEKSLIQKQAITYVI